MKTYYSAGGARVAVRSGSSTLSFILSDHLGSTSVTTDSGGAFGPERRYKAWGESRYDSGTLPTKFTYTGQYSNVAEFGLMYYGARWYDSQLSRFLSPDTIIPGAGNPQAWDRFAYALNSPVIFIDPTGHAAGSPTCNYDPDFTGSLLFGIRFKDGSKKWNLRSMLAVMEGVRAAAKRYAEITHGRASNTFRAVHNTNTTNPLVLEMGCPECTKMGQTYGSHLIKIEKFYPDWRTDKDLRDTNFFTHELGHAFNAQMANDLGVASSPYQVLNRRQSGDPAYPNRIETLGIPYGFASPSGKNTWQQSSDPSYREEFADQFLGWTFNKWEAGLPGYARASFMNANMQLWVSMTGYP